MPIGTSGQSAKPDFEALLEGQQGGGRYQVEGHNIPEGGSHGRKGFSPGHTPSHASWNSLMTENRKLLNVSNKRNILLM